MPSVGVTPPSWALAVALCVEAVGEEPWEASLCALPCVSFPLAEATEEPCAFWFPELVLQEVSEKLSRPIRTTADTLTMGLRIMGPPTALYGCVGRKYSYFLYVNELISQVVAYRSPTL